ADALDPEGAPHPAALDDDPGLLQADDLEGGTEQLPRHPAELARADPRELSSHGIPPSSPEQILASAWVCASLVAGSTTNTALPLPSWIAFGQSTMAAHLTPPRSTSPQRPRAIAMP